MISSVQPSASLASAALPTSAGTNVARRSPTQQARLKMLRGVVADSSWKIHEHLLRNVENLE